VVSTCGLKVEAFTVPIFVPAQADFPGLSSIKTRLLAGQERADTAERRRYQEGNGLDQKSRQRGRRFGASDLASLLAGIGTSRRCIVTSRDFELSSKIAAGEIVG
jgi:hypothetical protein